MKYHLSARVHGSRGTFNDRRTSSHCLAVFGGGVLIDSEKWATRTVARSNAERRFRYIGRAGEQWSKTKRRYMRGIVWTEGKGAFVILSLGVFTFARNISLRPLIVTR